MKEVNLRLIVCCSLLGGSPRLMKNPEKIESACCFISMEWSLSAGWESVLDGNLLVFGGLSLSLSVVGCEWSRNPWRKVWNWARVSWTIQVSSFWVHRGLSKPFSFCFFLAFFIASFTLHFPSLFDCVLLPHSYAPQLSAQRGTSTWTSPSSQARFSLLRSSEARQLSTSYHFQVHHCHVLPWCSQLPKQTLF